MLALFASFLNKVSTLFLLSDAFDHECMTDSMVGTAWSVSFIFFLVSQRIMLCCNMHFSITIVKFKFFIDDNISDSITFSYSCWFCKGTGSNPTLLDFFLPFFDMTSFLPCFIDDKLTFVVVCSFHSRYYLCLFYKFYSWLLSPLCLFSDSPVTPSPPSCTLLSGARIVSSMFPPSIWQSILVLLQPAVQPVKLALTEILQHHAKSTDLSMYDDLINVFFAFGFIGRQPNQIIMGNESGNNKLDIIIVETIIFSFSMTVHSVSFLLCSHVS